MKKGKESRSLWWLWALLGTALLFGIIAAVIIVASFDSSFSGKKLALGQGNVAHIRIDGVILVDGIASTFGEQGTSSREIVTFIEDADADPKIQAILLDINSPGGSAVASEEIANALLRANKPTIALIREIGASGGYWVASATDHVIANRMSITGSIGVISSYLEFSGLMEKYGVGYERLVAGDRKDLGNPFNKLSPNDRAIIQRELDVIHKYFIDSVAKNRGLTTEQVKKLATGETFLGSEALTLGLVDQVGDMQAAKEHLQETLDADDITLVPYQREPTLFEVLAGVINQQSFQVGQGIGGALRATPEPDLTPMAR